MPSHQNSKRKEQKISLPLNIRCDVFLLAFVLSSIPFFEYFHAFISFGAHTLMTIYEKRTLKLIPLVYHSAFSMCVVFRIPKDSFYQILLLMYYYWKSSWCQKKTINAISSSPIQFSDPFLPFKPFTAQKFGILPHILFIVWNENEVTIWVRVLWISYTKHTQEYESTKNNRMMPKNPPKKIHAVPCCVQSFSILYPWNNAQCFTYAMHNDNNMCMLALLALNFLILQTPKLESPELQTIASADSVLYVRCVRFILCIWSWIIFFSTFFDISSHLLNVPKESLCSPWIRFVIFNFFNVPVAYVSIHSDQKCSYQNVQEKNPYI